MHPLRTEAGLSARQAGQILGRSGATVVDLSRLVARGERAGVLVGNVRRALSMRGTAGAMNEPTCGWIPRPLPGLPTCRLAAGLTQPELAARASVARETLGRIERGRNARPETIGRLAAALALAPSVLMEGSLLESDHCHGLRRYSDGNSAGDGHGTDLDSGLSRAGGVLASSVAGPIAPAAARYPLPGLVNCRRIAWLSQQGLASRVGLARETLGRLEGGRAARLNTVRLLARELKVMPSMLTGTPDLDPINEPSRRCTACFVLRPLQAFVAIRGTSGHYGRCRICRNARARAPAEHHAPDNGRDSLPGDEVNPSRSTTNALGF